MLHIVLGRDWTANRDEILSRIASDVHNRKGNRILIVPELISHEMERKLCAVAGDTSSRYAEVLSFSRLSRRVTDSLGNSVQECLDNGGRVVAMAAAARQLSSRLKAYAAVETKPEFLSGIIDAVDEFKRCCITSQDLKMASYDTEGNLAQKLEELSLIMEAYDTLCSHGKRDPRDQMTLLLELLECGTFGEEHVFYIDGFPDFTRQNLHIIEYLIRTSQNVTVSLNCDKADSDLFAFEKAAATAKQLIRSANNAGIQVSIEMIEPKPTVLAHLRNGLFQGKIQHGVLAGYVQAFRAESAYQACLHAAGRIQSMVESGCRYRDISLVCTDMNVYQPLVDLVFHRFHIPVYRAGTEDILQKSVIATVLTAVDAAISGFDQREMVRYLRSALSPLDSDTCDLVENYAIIWGIRGKKWTQEWNYHPDGLSGEWDRESQYQLTLLNAARELAIVPLENLRKSIHDSKLLREQVMAVYSFLEEIQLEQRLVSMAEDMDSMGDNRSAQVLNQLWEILISALEQLYDVLGDTHWEPEHFSRLFRLLLSQYDVGTIPPVLDAVQMGPVSAMRCNQQKHLIVLGAEEGKLPGYNGSSGILSDQERVALRQLGVPLTGGAMEGIQAEFAEIYGVFCGATETVSVYCAAEQPSFIFHRIAQLAGGEINADIDMGFATADAFEAGAYLAKFNAKAVAQRIHVLDDYAETIQKKNYSLGKVDKNTIRKLYGSTLQLSASQVDRQAECRFSYFLKYGLRAKERKEATVDPAEFGTYVHAVLENTVRCIRDQGGFRRISLQDTLEIAHRFSDEYAAEHFSQLDSERMTYLFQRNIQELDMVVQELWQELSESAFEPKAVEVNFGSPEGLPAINIPNDAMRAILRGFVDRVDVWKSAGSSYYRVVDYKTGKKDFDYCDVFNGVGLQMLLYLFALRDSGSTVLEQGSVPAGVQYFPARAPYLPSDGRMEPDEAESERQSHWKRKGLLLQDTSVLQAMEPGEKPKRLNYSIRKDGSLSGDLADREQLSLLEDYIFHILGDMVEDIASGNVQPNPYTRGSSHSACAFCPYGAVCHETEVEGRRNYKSMTAQRFWDEIRKEQKNNGG